MHHRGPRQALGLALGLALVATASAGAKPGATPVARTPAGDEPVGGAIAYAAGQEPSGFNLATSKDNLLELRHIVGRIWPSAYIVQPDLSLKPSPVLDGPARVVSEDPFTVEWRIAAAATWDDGVAVSAEDFEWVYRSCNNKIDPGEPTAPDRKTGKVVSALDCASNAGYDQVTRFETLGPKLFRMTFAQRFVEYEQLFGEGLPPAHIGKARPGGWNTGFDADPGASAGPYRLKEAVRGDHYTLERNPRYWGPRARLDTIVFREIPDLSSHPDALRNDEVQVIYTQPQIDLVQQVAAIPATVSNVTFGPTWEHLDFNMANPLLAQREVRQAIAYGLDRDRYVNTLMRPFSAQARRLDNRVFMSTQPTYEPHGAPYAKRSPAAAQALLEKAGFARGSDGIYAKGGQRLSFRVRAKTPNALREQLEQLMQEDLKGIGIELRIANFSEPESIGSVGSGGDFDLFLFGWTGTPFAVSGAQQIYGSRSSSNYGRYASAAVDAAIAKAATTLDEGERTRQLNAIDELLWQDLPNIPLFQRPAGLLAHAERYVHIIDNPTSEGLFWNAEQWVQTAAPS